MNKIGLILLVCFTFINCSFHKSMMKAGKAVISNQYVQKHGSTALFLYSQYEEATADAVNYGGTYGAKKELWHLYKNRSKFALMSSMILKGIAVGQEHTTMRETGKRFFFECIAAWVIWHWRYRYVKYGTPFEFSKYANQHAIYIPNPITDSYIGLEGTGVMMFDLLRISGGIYGLWKY